MSHFFNCDISTNFCPVEIDLSGNTIWPPGFQKRTILIQYWMRLFLWFSYSYKGMEKLKKLFSYCLIRKFESFFFVFKALEINGEGNGNNEGVAQHPDLVLQMQENRLREKIKKQSRTHALLVSIVVVFALSWLPLNSLNVILDVSNIGVSNNFHAQN